MFCKKWGSDSPEGKVSCMVNAKNHTDVKSRLEKSLQASVSKENRFHENKNDQFRSIRQDRQMDQFASIYSEQRSVRTLNSPRFKTVRYFLNYSDDIHVTTRVITAGGVWRNVKYHVKHTKTDHCSSAWTYSKYDVHTPAYLQHATRIAWHRCNFAGSHLDCRGIENVAVLAKSAPEHEL